MDIPQVSLSAEEIKSYWQKAEGTLKQWERVKTSINAVEFATYREALSDAKHGIETILDLLQDQYSDLRRKMGAVKLLLKDLSRHDELSKEKYWQLRKSL